MSSDDDTGDDVPLAELIGGMKLPSAQSNQSVPKVLKKAKPKKRKKKKDPNEPQKPISAYALFFKDRQAAIKGQNPSANFGEVSKIVASMWDGLEPEAKNVYKKTAEAAKKEYLKELALYRANLASEGVSGDTGPAKNVDSSPVESSSPSGSPAASPPAVSSPVQTSEKIADDESSEIKSAPQVINLADSPELMDGNDMDTNVNNVDDDDIQIIPPEDSPALLRELSAEKEAPSGKQPDSEVAQGSSSPSSVPDVQQGSASEAPVNGDIPNASEIETKQTCLRNGCNNLAIDSPEWDREYCSSECVVYHCRDVFNAWVASKRMSPTY